MLVYILIFFVMACVFTALLTTLICLKALGLIPLVNRVVTRIFATNYDKKYQESLVNGPSNLDCYICLEKCSYDVVTTCNHSFCSDCILSYLRTIPAGEELRCPACRKEICLLFRRFEPVDSKGVKLKKQVAQFNCKLSKEFGIWRAIVEFSNIFNHLSVLCSAEGIKFMIDNPRTKKIILLLIYSLCPIDLLPEMFLGPLGLIDDTFASLELLRQFANLWIEFVRDEDRRERLRV